ncbi:MAG TPA: L-aspartate oxidase, partial [Ruminococcaceae bacterium]|nr:L-aspartate oxidase [Oscillospiraceae bacterium]
RVMQHYCKRGERTPRDVVSHCIMEEEKKTKSHDFYLDITEQPAEFVRNRFPAIYQKCLEYDVDMTKDRIPVYPCQHYLMGGIDVDLYARTTIEGLYAVGECAHTGVHGANRLASNSLLEALVFSKRAAQDILKKRNTLISAKELQPERGEEPSEALRDEIRFLIQESFFVNADIEKAQKNLPRVQEIQRQLQAGYAASKKLTELRSLAGVANMILKEVLSA